MALLRDYHAAIGELVIRYDQISHLRRQKAPQPTRALDFAYLVGDALLELLV